MRSYKIINPIFKVDDYIWIFCLNNKLLINEGTVIEVQTYIDKTQYIVYKNKEGKTSLYSSSINRNMILVKDKKTLYKVISYMQDLYMDNQVKLLEFKRGL